MKMNYLKKCLRDNGDLGRTAQNQTMTSTQFAEMTGRELKSINRTIKEQFKDEIDGARITPSIDSRGYAIEYYTNRR